MFACVAAGLLVAGCGTAPDDQATGPLTVYLSVPLRGPTVPQGEDIRDGAELALEQAGGMAGDVEVDLTVLDDTAGGPKPARWSPAVVAENARMASQDTSAIAYIGDFESGATRVSLPITNQAMVPQVSPASTAINLVNNPEDEGEPPAELQPSGKRTFLRVIPDDRVQAEAAAAWARRLGVRTAATLSDGTAFGDAVVEEFAEAAAGRGIEVAESQAQGDLANRAELVYVGGEGNDAALRLHFAAAAVPDALLMSTHALAFLAGADELESRLRLTSSAQAPEQLPPAGQEFVTAFEDEYGRTPGPYAAYGYEAMALVLDAIERAGPEAEDRRAVLDALFATSDRESILGTYSITAVGDTTLEAVAGYRFEDGGPVFERALAPP